MFKLLYTARPINTLQNIYIYIYIYISERHTLMTLKGGKTDLIDIPVADLDQLLAHVILSVRKKDGQEYEPTSLRSIVGSVDRTLM